MSLRVLACVLGLLALVCPAAADEPGPSVTLPPVLASAAALLRQALVIEPGPADPTPRTDALRRDAGSYRDLLRLLGFAVTTLSPATRPDLDAGLRGFARRVEPGADVAVFVLGDLRPTADGLTLAPPGTMPDRIEAEGVRLGDALRRAVERGPRALALVIDGCTGSAEACAAGLQALPRGVGALLARRAADAPGTLGPALLPALPVEGRTLPQLRDALGLDGSADLPSAFAFLPAGFLAGLPLACNGVDPELSADALRGRPTLEPLVAACREAAARYAFSPFFGAKLAAARDQEAARRALTSCAEAAALPGRFPDRTLSIRRRDGAARLPGPTPHRRRGSAPARSGADSFATAGRRSRGGLFPPPRLCSRRLLRRPRATLRARGRGAGRARARRRDHMRRLGAWYGAYDSVRFRVVPGSLDFAGCARAADCRLRGRYRLSALPAGRDAYEQQEQAFSLRLDLESGRVLAECGVAEPPAAAPCE